jgi:hypothetical protein
MSMPPYPVMCYAAGCPNRAAFKVAARWSDGVTDELKTYYLACADCLAQLYASAGAKRAACRLAPGETLDAVGVYELTPATRDKQLVRRKDLEHQGKASP